MRAPIFILATMTVSSLATGAELVTTPQPVKAARKPAVQVTTATHQTDAPQPTRQERRCAYLGRWGSFHIIGSDGTAAYRFPSGTQHFAELRIGRPNPNWWIYRQLPSDTADPAITAWALAREPYCGKWPVLMFRNGAWQTYENTYAWGKGMGQDPIGAGESNPAIFDLERDVRGLKKDVRELKSKVDVLEQGRR